MNAMQTFRPVKSEINITYQKSFFMRKRSLINVLDKKCDFALCISKIDVKAMCEFQLAWFFFNFLINSCVIIMQNQCFQRPPYG